MGEPLSGSRHFFHAGGPQLGLQIYPFLEQLQRDFEGTLREIAALGYRQIEMLTFMGRSGQATRKVLDSLQMSCRSVHVLAQAVPGSHEPTLGGDVSQVIDNALALGARYVVMPSFSPPSRAGAPRKDENYIDYFHRAAQMMQADDWKALADQLNTLGAPLRKQGLTIAYHNHNPEFAPLGDTSGFQILMERTDPALVTFEIDVAWVAAAGVDPVKIFQTYPGRFRLMHVKDLLPKFLGNFAFQMESVPVGSGMIDWPRVLHAARSAGVEEYLVEQEPPFIEPPAEAVRKSRNFLLQLTT